MLPTHALLNTLIYLTFNYVIIHVYTRNHYIRIYVYSYVIMKSMSHKFGYIGIVYKDKMKVTIRINYLKAIN